MRTWSHAVRMTCLDVQAGIGSVARHLRELDRLGDDLDVLDRDIAQAAINDPAVKRLLTITGVNLIVAAGLIAAIGDVRRFPAPRSSSATSASTRGCRSPAWVSRSMAVSANRGVHMRAPCWSRRHGRQPRPQGRCVRSSCASERGAVIRWQLSQSRGSWPCCAGTC
jgi:Transposase IS116/IS110/IS902 family